MNNRILIITGIAILAICTVCCVDSDNNGDSNNKVTSEDKALPSSLDEYYASYPSEYLIEMYKLGESMTGISVNIQQGDMENAAGSFKTFSEIYKNNTGLVPEWEKYYNQETVQQIGTALDSGDIPGVFAALEEVGNTCSECHLNTMPAVFDKYYWRDFTVVNIDTPVGAMPFKQGKMRYLLAGFDGIGLNIKEADQPGALQSYNLFKPMFDNMTVSCLSCHESVPLYYVGNETRALIDDMGEKIKAGDPVNLSAAEGIRQVIGVSCHKCHVIHIPPQYAKVKED
jgi:cytochrome c556